MSNDIKFRAVLEDKVSAPLGKLAAGMDKIGGKGTGGVAFGVLAAQGITSIGSAALKAGDAVAGFITDSISKASDFNETVTKSDVVFQTASGSVQSWAKTSATAMGLSENAALGAASSIGNLLRSTGTAPEKIAPMSESVVQLASDLASFNNIGTDEALAKLQSGLVGQERPLRELGVAISAASVDAKALALGFKKVNGEFSEGEKVQARYALILDQTKTAQGDFARTSDGMANQQRILSAELDDVEVSLGQKFIPFVIQGQRALIDLLGAVTPVIDGVSSFVDVLDSVVSSSKESAAASDFLGDNTTLLGKAVHGAAEDFGMLFKTLGDSLGIHPKVDAAMTGTGDHAGKMADDIHHATTKVASSMTGMAEHGGKALDDLALATYRAAHKSIGYFGDWNAAVHKFTDDLGSLADKAIAEYFDPIVEADKLAADKAEINAARRVLASKTATAAEKRDATATIHSLTQDMTDLRVKLALAGKLSKSGQAALLKDLTYDWAHATGAAKADLGDLITQINQMPNNVEVNVKVNRSLPKPKRKRAMGGPVDAGEAYTIGEQGPETLVMGKTGGYVIPHGGGGGSNMAPVVIALQLDGATIAKHVDERLYYMYARAANTTTRQ